MQLPESGSGAGEPAEAGECGQARARRAGPAPLPPLRPALSTPACALKAGVGRAPAVRAERHQRPAGRADCRAGAGPGWRVGKESRVV